MRIPDILDFIEKLGLPSACKIMGPPQQTDVPSKSVEPCSTQTKPCGYVIGGDNVDKNFRPSHQREDRRTRSLHAFHSCAIKNRIDVSSLSDAPGSCILTDQLFLLNNSDIKRLTREFKIHTAR